MSHKRAFLHVVKSERQGRARTRQYKGQAFAISNVRTLTILLHLTATLTMRFSTIVALVASIGLVSATPTPETSKAVTAFAGPTGDVALSTESGCGSVGPLGSGHYVWYIVVGCTPGSEM